MGDKSKIEWTDATWNPTVGCSIVSPGCTNCYAMKTAHSLERRFASKKYAGLTKVANGNAVWTGEVRLDEDALLQPLHWKKPKRIFVNSMSDLFHEALPDEAIDRVFAVMALCPQHTFQVLTKRSERMWDYLRADQTQADRLRAIAVQMQELGGPKTLTKWPFKNIWLGVSCERQEEADERIPHLLATPAAVRFISAEPLLEAIDIRKWLAIRQAAPSTMEWALGLGSDTCLDWVIVGGESGPHARPFHIEWADRLIAQCDGRLSCFIKQVGSAPMSSKYPMHLQSTKGGNPTEWPEHLRVRQFPKVRP